MIFTATGSAHLRDARFAVLSDAGSMRDKNDDRWLVEPDLHLFVVADGISSRQAGGLAAQVVVEAIPDALREILHAWDQPLSSEMLQEVCTAISAISSEVQAISANVPGIHGLGATVVFAVVRQLKAMIVHLGDSRCYRFSRSVLERLTNDHTVEQLLASSEQDNSDSFAPKRLARFIGMRERAIPSGKLIDLFPDDRLLLCTDGLTTVVSEIMVREIMQKNLDARCTCDELVQAVRTSGAPDNVTVMVVDVNPNPPRSAERQPQIA